MTAWFKSVLERLMFRGMSVLSAKSEAQLELELADARAQLLKRASELEAETAAGLPVLAERLTESSARLGQSDYLPAAQEQAARRILEQEHPLLSLQPEPQETAAIPEKVLPPKPPTASRPRRRNRPSRAASAKPAASQAADNLVAKEVEEGGLSDGQ